MLTRFIGANGSMGLIHGRYYPIEIKRLDEYLWVKIYTKTECYFRYCPYSSIKKFKENWEMTKYELSSFLSLVDDYQTSGGNNSLVNCAKSEVLKLMNMNAYTPNEYRLAMGMNEVVNPLDTRMEVNRVFTFQDLNGHYEVTTSFMNQQQSRILDSQVQCDAARMERLRYETQCKQTCCVPSYEFDDAVRNVYENMQALYADNIQIETMNKAVDSFKVKKRLTIYDLDRLIFPEDPIRDWVEKKTAEIEKKFAWADNL